MNSDIEKHIAANVTFEDLPQSVRQLVGNSEKEYNKQVLHYSIKTQLQYRGNLVSQLVKNERSYYEQLVESSRSQLMLYPYHLAEAVVAGLRITPFQYYCAALLDIMEQEKSYDALPNFTAVDCVRLLGIGRNQYIELMNQRKSSRSRLFMRKPGRELLPALPASTALQHLQWWWRVRLGRVTQHDVKSSVTSSEKVIIDLLIDNGPQKAGDIDKTCILSLYSKGLIYVDVPISGEDRVTVPPLEGFVMNRVTGDHMESLLYKVFVSIDERSSVEELSSILAVGLPLVQLAVSLFCRLGFAQLKQPPYAPVPPLHPSWDTPLPPDTPPTDSPAAPALDKPMSDSQIGYSHAELLQELQGVMGEDSSVYLEVDQGVLPPGGAAHSPHFPLTLSLPSATTPVDITASLHTPSTDDRCGPGLPGPATTRPGLDITTPGCGSDKRIAFLFDSTLTAFLMMGNLSPDLKTHAVTLFEVGKLPDEGLDCLLKELDKIPMCVSEGEAERYFTHAITLRTALTFLRRNPALGDSAGCALDLLRWESLSHLDTDTAARLLTRHYKLLVSMAPLQYSAPTLAPFCPPHFGPPAPAATTPWFLVMLYQAASSGPPSLLLPRGFRLRRVPASLLCHRRVMLSGWGQEPVMLPLHQVLTAANEALTHHPVLLQGYGWQEEPLTQHVCLPLEEDDVWSRCGAVVRAVEELQLQHAFGYLQLVAFPHSPPTPPPAAEGDDQDEERALVGGQDWMLHSCHLGMPLFSAALNDAVSRKVARLGLLSDRSVSKFVAQQRHLVAKLDAFIQEYKGYDSGASAIPQPPSGPARCPLPSLPLHFYGGHLSFWDGR